MRTSLKIGEIFGIPVRLHVTLLLIVAFIAWSVGSNLFQIAELIGVNPTGISPGIQSYLIGLVLAIGLFVSVFLHEIAHSITAQSVGVKIKEITLWVFGGVSNMEEIPREPELEIRISIVGPLTSLGVGAISYLVGFVFSQTLLAFTFKYIGIINFILAGFNLLPAFPMDGGRILRAFFARSDSYVSATNKAADVGKAFAIAMGITGFFVNPFLIIIAFFVYMGASQEAQQTEIKELLEEVRVRDIMSEEVKTISPGENLRDFLDYIMEVHHTGFPVVRDGETIGIITREDTTNVKMDRLDDHTVEDVMERDIICFSPDDLVSEVWKRMNEENVGRFPIMEDGELVGIVTRTDVMRSLEVLDEIERYRRD